MAQMDNLQSLQLDKWTHVDPPARAAIVTLDTKTLWSILCSGNALTERFCNELTWAKAELRRRGFVIA